MHDVKGQTMLETIVAIFVLVSGVVGSFSLATFALTISARSMQEAVAINLAREGVEAVRNIRDTNWLSGTLASCPAMGSGQSCYQNWNQGIEGNPARDYQLEDPRSPNPLRLFPVVQRPEDYRLYEVSSGGYVARGAGPVQYFRKISISECSSSDPVRCPSYDPSYPELIVTASVWWKGRRCPEVSEPDFTACKAVVTERLTNWKNY